MNREDLKVGTYYFVEDRLSADERNLSDPPPRYAGVWRCAQIDTDDLHPGKCFWEGIKPPSGFMFSHEILREATPEEIMRAVL